MWRPDDILILALLGVTSYSRRAVLLVGIAILLFVGIVTTLTSTMTDVILKVSPLLASGSLGNSHLIVDVALIV